MTKTTKDYIADFRKAEQEMYEQYSKTRQYFCHRTSVKHGNWIEYDSRYGTPIVETLQQWMQRHEFNKGE